MIWTDYLLALPITLLVLFALGILLIDFMLPDDMKRLNAVTAFIGVCFSAAGVLKIQMTLPNGAVGMLGTMHVDRIAIYFFYLFLAGTAIAILNRFATYPFHPGTGDRGSAAHRDATCTAHNDRQLRDRRCLYKCDRLL